MKKYSAGIILFQKEHNQVSILLGHMGGPFWSKKDQHAWTIPKGEFDPDNENPEKAARREFKEETGVEISEFLISLPPFSKNNKRFYIFLCEKYIDPNDLKSNLFEIEWPPRSRKIQKYPELDRFGWFSLEEAKLKLVKGQIAALEMLPPKIL